MRERYIKNLTNYKVVITTDTRAAEIAAYNEFGRERVVSIIGPFAHLDRENNLSTVEACSKVDKTFLDFHAMQYCDSLVISASGFGKLGAWNRPEPNKELVMFTLKQEFYKAQSMNQLFIY